MVYTDCVLWDLPIYYRLGKLMNAATLDLNVREALEGSLLFLGDFLKKTLVVIHYLCWYSSFASFYNR